MILLMISNCERVRVRFFKKIHDWTLESEGIRKRIIVCLLDRSIQGLLHRGASKEPKNPFWMWFFSSFDAR